MNNSEMSAETAADKSGADDNTTSSHSSANTFVGSSLHIVSKQCVNSKWIASWLAKKGQECCECIVECKIRVNYKGHEYVVNKHEYRILIKSLKRNRSAGKLAE